MSDVMLKKKDVVDLIPAEQPITEFVSKLGGQPNWLNVPEWPLSAELGTPMRFIGQIKIDKELFPESKAEMAYIFMTDDSDEYVDGTWEADGGENAVILQPGKNTGIKTDKIKVGPTLQNYVKKDGFEMLQPVDVEFHLVLNAGIDSNLVRWDQLEDLSEAEKEEFYLMKEGSKIGGTPGFIQSEEFPDEKTDWLLLLQLDSCDLRYTVNFGDAGISYTFINKQATKAKFLWQCL
jgi:uncharacterized protein YwqG